MAVRYFALRTTENGSEKAVFTGRQPRQAALKAASRGYSTIFLRERGTSKLHQYKGLRKKVRAPAERPDWMPAVVWKPNVKKMKVIHLKPKKAKAVKKTKRRKTAKRAVKRKAKKRTVKRKVKKTVKRKAPRRAKKTARRKTTKRRTTKRRR